MPLIYNKHKIAPVVVSANVQTQVKNVTPTKEEQAIIPDPGMYLGKVIVEPIPSEYVVPSGTLNVRANGIYNVKDYAEINAELTPALISIPIDSNRWVADTSLYPYNQKAVVSVNLGNLTTNSTIRLINDNESEGIFAKYGFYATTANNTSITIFAIDKPLADIILKVEITYGEGESGIPAINNPVSIVRKDKLAEICNNTVEEILPSDLDSATQIRDYMFYGNTNLLKLELPETVTTINASAFYGCSGLINLKLPQSLITIKGDAFTSCGGLTEVVLPNALTSVGSNAFRSCGRLTDIFLPESLLTLGDYTFRGCSSLTEVVIPKNVTIIPQNLFRECGNLRKVVIEGNITQVGREVFSYDTGFQTLVIKKVCTAASDVPALAAANIFMGTSYYIYVPDELTKSLYQNATNWSAYSSRFRLISELGE